MEPTQNYEVSFGWVNRYSGKIYTVIKLNIFKETFLMCVPMCPNGQYHHISGTSNYDVSLTNYCLPREYEVSL